MRQLLLTAQWWQSQLWRKRKAVLRTYLPTHLNEEIIEADPILKEVYAKDNTALKVDRHLVKVPDKGEFERPLEIFTKFEEHKTRINANICRFDASEEHFFTTAAAARQ